MKIGVYMIVKDCAKELRRSLSWARSLYDYVSIVDTGSSDDTLKVAEEFGAIVTHYKPKWDKPFLDDFGTARNVAMSALPDVDWYIWLDSDDIVKDARQFRYEINQLNKKNLMMFGCPYILDNTKMDGTIKKIRGWRKGAAYWKYRIHEQITATDPSYLKLVGLVWSPITHERPETKEVNSYARNIAILEDAIAETPNEHYVKYLIREYALNGMHDKALRLQIRYNGRFTFAET